MGDKKEKLKRKLKELKKLHYDPKEDHGSVEELLIDLLEHVLGV